MKISPVNSRSQEQRTSMVKKSAGNEFSANMDMAQKEHAEKELKEMLEKINKLGEELKDNPSLQRIKEYKKQIGDYLSFVLKHYYKLSQHYGRYSTQLLVRVEVINKKIEELTDEFMKQQKGNIDIIDRIEEISGLLIDLYR